MELTYIFYSHTDFLDILKIASDYSKTIKNKKHTRINHTKRHKKNKKYTKKI